MILRNPTTILEELTADNSWIGVDFDGTLAETITPFDMTKVGKPIPAMVARVRKWRSQGKQVKIFTARAAEASTEDLSPVRDWSRQHLGEVLPITASKDKNMVALWDDLAVAVERNTGRVLGGSP